MENFWIVCPAGQCNQHISANASDHPSVDVLSTVVKSPTLTPGILVKHLT